MAIVDAYWASHLGCSKDDLQGETIRIIRHGKELADYHGLFAFFRHETPVVSLPDACFGSLSAVLRALPTSDLCSPARFASVISAHSDTVIGPAFIGYADEITLRSISRPVRLLTSEHQSLVTALQATCPEIEWQHGGTRIGERPAFGVLVGDDLASIAGYEIWGGAIAHISVVTHPRYRKKGHARVAVTHAARHALEHGLVPQYRTLISNHASMRIADFLGFHPVATSVAARLSYPT
ncbi:MAG: GNAT family N-acetyltransferase [Methylacidiphilales bacterium]|nr:GNAT family N-acetyltransferase [Candidatus Methylacidiphilales bacterium]